MILFQDTIEVFSSYVVGHGHLTYDIYKWCDQNNISAFCVDSYISENDEFLQSWRVPDANERIFFILCWGSGTG